MWMGEIKGQTSRGIKPEEDDLENLQKYKKISAGISLIL